MIKFKFAISSESKVVDRSGEIHQNGFSSFKLIPTGRGSSFGDKFNEYYDNRISDVVTELTNINNEATDIKNTVIDLSTNLTTNYLSEAELFDPATIGLITSSIAESTATFVTAEQAGQWYGLELTTDVNGKKYITGFDIGALVNPGAGTSDSYFRINADRFIVGGDLGDGAFSTMVDVNGDPLPAFSIVQNGVNPPEMFFNGKVNISAVPSSLNKLIGRFASETAVNLYIQDSGEEVTAGDSYYNTTDKIMYFWDGSSWISAEGKLEIRSFVFRRSKNVPSTPSGGTYSSPIPTTAGWSDGIPSPSFSVGQDWSNVAIDPVWVSHAIFDNKTNYVDTPIVWSEPELMVDTPNNDIMYNNSLTTPATPTYTGDLLTVSTADAANGWYNNANVNAVWVAQRKKTAGQWTPWVVYKVKGESGEAGTPGSNGQRGSLLGRGSGAYWPTGAQLNAIIWALPGAGGASYAGDMVIWTNTASGGGTEIYEYNGSTWGSNTALTINGNAIITGTLYVSGNNITAGTIVGSAIQVASGNSWTTSGAMYITEINGVGNVYSSSNINTNTLTVRSNMTCSNANTSIQAAYINTGGYGGGGAGNAYGISTGTYKAYIGGGVAPFTGVHIGYSVDTGLVVGDIVSSEDAWVVDVAQTLVHLVKSGNMDKRVFGIVNTISEDVLGNIRNNISVAEEAKELVVVPARYTDDEILIEEERTELVGTGVWTIKPQFKPYADKLVNDGYVEVSVNSLGEGGINVCNYNGDILNGDYICSSGLLGKGMKQNDDIMHNYTVGKALESVIWENEMIGENGCFEQDGYKCKMIACTYHSG